MSILLVLLMIVAIALLATIRVAVSRIELEIGDTERLREVPVKQPPIFLASIPPTSRQNTVALFIIAAMLTTFGLIIPSVRIDGPRLLAFPPMGDALLCVIYFITGFILLGQFLRVRLFALMVLACGFFYQSVMTIIHGISFSEASLFMVSEQLTPWLYFLWRGVAPLFIIGYALFHDRLRYVKHAQLISWFGIGAVLLLSIGGGVAMTHWSQHLPSIISGVDYTRTLILLISPMVLLVNFVALTILWLRSNNVLDLWLMVATVGSILDVTISSIIGNQRFDFGYYAGRGFGLLSACIILGALLNEMYRLYGNLYEMMEHRLQRSEAQYRAIVDSAVDAIISINEKGTISSFNRSAEQIFGYQESEVIGRNVKMLMAEPYRSNHDQYLQNYLTTGVRKIIGIGREVQGITKDGVVLSLELSVAEWANGDGRRFTGMLRDVSERKRLEKQLIQSQKMEAVGQLTGGMAHDFNNLLGVVIGNLDMLSDHFPDGAPEELNDAINASNAGADLVRRLLAFARRQPLLPKIINLDEIIEGLIPLVRRMIGDQIVIETQFDKHLMPVLADPAQLENALLNLIINARDAMPLGGRLVIECRNHDVDEDSSVEYDVPIGCYTALVVSDTGKGIAPHILPHVFEPFFSTKPPGAGSGLGLSMVYGYAKQSGGVVRIYSEVGTGTSVRLYLPSVVESAEDNGSGQEIVDIASLHGNERILVVEDTPAALVVAQRILLSLGYTVRLARDATEAIGFIDSGENFDLLFTDIIMPGGINGLELARMVKQRRPLIKILFASGFSQTPVTDIENLAACYITKPYRKIDIAKMIRELLEKR